jgi:glycosyltransferase involved in cell wall biosynthesis
MSVTVAICCHNSAARLQPTLEHLAAQQVPAGLRWEVLIVDNASTDYTAAAAARFWPAEAPATLRVVTEPRLGIRFARMRACDEAAGEFICFVDDDNWLAPDWVATASEILTRDPTIGACGGWNDAVSDTPLPAWFDRYKTYFAISSGARSEDTPHPVDVLFGAGMALRVAAWREIRRNGFQIRLGRTGGQSMTSGEDDEICLALRAGGWTLWHDPRLYLQHFISPHRLTWAYLRRLVRGIADSTAALRTYYWDQAKPRDPSARVKATFWWGIASCSLQLFLHPVWTIGSLSIGGEGDGVVRADGWRSYLTALLRHRSRKTYLALVGSFRQVQP